MSDREKKEQDTGSLRLIFGWVTEYWKRHPAKLGFLVAMTMVYTALAISYPIFFKLVVDGLRSCASRDEIGRNVLFLLALGGGAAIINWLLMSTRGWTNMKIEVELRERLFGHLTAMGPGFYHQHHTGDLITRLTDDLGEKLSWYTCSGVFRALQGAFLFTFVVAVMVRMNYKLALLALLPMPFIIAVFFWGERGFEKRYHRLQQAISQVNDFLEACFSGIRVIKVYNREHQQRQSFGAAMSQRIGAEMAAIRADGLYNAFNQFINQAGVMVVMLAGGYLVIGGKLSLGSFVAFNTYSLMLIEPFWNMSNFFMAGKRAAVSYSRIVEILKFRPEVAEAATAPAGFRNNIAFQGVTFGYGPGHPVLKDVSFEIKKGQRVAIVGEVGSGKTTLANLLMRFSDPQKGRIMIDGRDIREMGLKELRGLMGYAPQEALLFSETILNNIIFHREDVDRDRALVAGSLSQLEQEVAKFERGYDTLIGQRGTSLSGGQRQRASLARAVAERVASGHPQILILDDITSALDAATEARVWQEIESQLPGVTCFIISHRNATIERADLIVVLKEGQVVEMGSHAELMERNGYYVTLRERQRLDENGNGGGPR